MNCSSCGAPLRAKTHKCCHCGSINAVDLASVSHYTSSAPQSPRWCPECEIILETLNVRKEGSFLVDRCPKCYGLFFDSNELGALVDAFVKHVFEVDQTKFEQARNNSHAKPHTDKVRYVKCPVCRKLMNRQNYGLQSGVIIDCCRDDGIWLNGGELSQIFAWTKAGGDIHSDREVRERDRLKTIDKAREERWRKLRDSIDNYGEADASIGIVKFFIDSF